MITFIHCYPPLSSKLTALLSHVILNVQLVGGLKKNLIALLEYPPKWCMGSAAWLLHGWCHVKPLPSRGVLRTPYNHAPCHVVSSKATEVGCVNV